MLFAAFWVGGQVATVLVLWAEWYGDREFPPSVRMLSPLQVALAVFFCIGFWPGFMVMMAVKRRQVHDENEADAELADELARRYPETHGYELSKGVPIALCKYPCHLVGLTCPTARCRWCDSIFPPR